MAEELNLVDGAVERNDTNLKEMLEATKNVVSHWVVDRASTRFIIRKIGYGGFTVSYAYFKPTGLWTVEGFDVTPDSLRFFMDNFGEQLDSDKQFYQASHAYSEQVHGIFE